MKDYQERVVKERDDLVVKIEKLRAFFRGDVFKTFDEIEQDRLFQQWAFMLAYARVLEERIAAFLP